MGAQVAVWGREWGVQKKEEMHLGRVNRCSGIQNRPHPGGEKPGHGTHTVRNSSAARDSILLHLIYP